jgi:hypothetical protein
MNLYDIIDCRAVANGAPVSRDNAENWHVLIGEWQDRSNGNGRRWKELVGSKIDLDSASPPEIVIGGDNVARVMQGRLIYRRNQLLLSRCEDPDDQRAMITFRYTAEPRKPIASGKAHEGSVQRWLNGNNIDPYFTHTSGTSLLAFLLVQAGSKLWVEEERELRVAGTGASLTNWFNRKQTKKVTCTPYVFDFDGAASRNILNTISRGVANEQSVSIEAWSGSSTAVFSIQPSTEPGLIRARAIEELKLPPGASAEFEEVAR